MSGATLRTIVGIAALYKAVEFATVAPWWFAVPLAIGGIAVLAFRSDRLCWVVALGALLVNVTPIYWNHLTLLMWVALAIAVFPNPRQRKGALMVLLSAVYGFAALAKVWPDWLSGESLVAHTWLAQVLPHPLVVVVAVLTLVVEVTLAVTVWHTWRGWFWLAVALHTGFLVFIDSFSAVTGQLVVFELLALSCWLYGRNGPGTSWADALWLSPPPRGTQGRPSEGRIGASPSS